MTWQAYQISFELLSPLHVGWRKLGNLQQTRPYVTGRNLWGALTARLTREKGDNDYKGMGEQVDENLVFTYFYPSTYSDKVTLWPWDNQEEFTWQFLNSYASTALADGHSSEEGTLHETEYIAPRTREGCKVYLVGYIFVKNSHQLNWEVALGKLQFGGERGYGWGRVKLFENKELSKEDKCFCYNLNCSGKWPTLTAAATNCSLLAHTQAENYSVQSGVLEPLVGMLTNTISASFGANLSKAEICWVPGSQVNKNEKFLVMEKGLWHSYR